MNFEFDQDQKAILDTVKIFLQRELAPHVEEIQDNDHLPDGFFKKAGELGIIGLSMPEEFGGSEMPVETLMAVYTEIGKVCPGPTIAITTTLAGMEIIRKYGSQELKDKYLEACIMGDIVGSMAFTEAGTGSDPKQLTTVATEDKNYIILNGVKRFITNAAYPGPMIVYAKASDDGACSAYVIDKFCDGYSLSSKWEKIGLRGSPIYDVFLDNICIPKTNRVGKKGAGFDILLSESAVGKMGHAAMSLGIMEACKSLGIKYAKEKLHREKPITKFQAIQLKIADICMLTESAKWMVYKCAALASKDTTSQEFRAYAALVKAYAAETVPKVALMAMNLMGAYGPMREYQVERYLRDAVTEPHVEVVSDVQRIISAGYFIAQE